MSRRDRTLIATDAARAQAERVLELVLAGRSRLEIGDAIGLGPSAVERVLVQLRRRHYVTTTVQLVVKVLLERCAAVEQRAELAEARLGARDADEAMVERHRAARPAMGGR